MSARTDGWYYDPATCTFSLYRDGEVYKQVTEELVIAAAEDAKYRLELRIELFGYARTMSDWPERLLAIREQKNKALTF